MIIGQEIFFAKTQMTTIQLKMPLAHNLLNKTWKKGGSQEILLKMHFISQWTAYTTSMKFLYL